MYFIINQGNIKHLVAFWIVSYDDYETISLQLIFAFFWFASLKLSIYNMFWVFTLFFPCLLLVATTVELAEF